MGIYGDKRILLATRISNKAISNAYFYSANECYKFRLKNKKQTNKTKQNMMNFESPEAPQLVPCVRVAYNDMAIQFIFSLQKKT